MTRFLQDILRQPGELLRVIAYLGEAGRNLLDSAADAIRGARHTYITGIGASWNAALGAAAIFHSGGRPVYMLDAAELLQFGSIPAGSVIVILSRSGKSIEVVKLLAKARDAGATVIGITNFEDGQLARESDIRMILPVKADNGISVNTYSVLAAVAAAVASATVGSFDDKLAASLAGAIGETERSIPGWQRQVAETSWLAGDAMYYFLGRGSCLASAYEASLLWEEGAKLPAAAMGAGSFRHGPQEVVTREIRFGMWIDGKEMREQDLAVAHDLRRMGAAVMLIGCGIPQDGADLVFAVPEFPRHWQFLGDIVPAQLAAERLAHIRGVDCDSFRFASYIVQDDQRLLSAGSYSRQPERT